MKRDKDNLRWQVGLWIAAIVVLGFIIRLSADLTDAPKVDTG